MKRGSDCHPNSETAQLLSKIKQSEENQNAVEISVGICLKSKGKTTRQAIRSALDQTFPHKRMEIIVVDSDDTNRTHLFVSDLLSKSDVEFQIFSDNGNGLGVARDIVLNNARGRFIVWLDDDMVFSRDLLKKQFDLMNGNPRIGVAAARYISTHKGSIVARLETLSNASRFEPVRNKDIERVAMNIIRVEAALKAGGFDRTMAGAGEDSDLVGRIRAAGYLLCQGDGELEHVERQTWKGLWIQSFWYGYGMHYLNHKNKSLVNFRLRFLPLSFAEGTMRSILAFVDIHQWICFLLPFFNVFKAIAWWRGFFQAHKEDYGHRIS